MTKIVHHSPKPATMTSIELADVINEARRIEAAGAPFSELRHDHLMAKIVKVLGAAAPAFSGTVLRPQPAGGSREYPCYHLPKREAELVAMSESYAVQARVYDRMIELETATLPSPAPTTRAAAPKPALLVAAGMAPTLMRALRSLGIDTNAAAISANQIIRAETGVNLLQLAGHTHLVTPTQEICFTPTELGKRFCQSAKAFNRRLAEAGLQEHVSGHWVPTEKGAPHAVVLDTGKAHSSGTPIQQVKWIDSVLAEVAL